MPPERWGQTGESGGPPPLDCIIPRGWAGCGSIFQKPRGPLLCQALTFELPDCGTAGGPRGGARVTGASGSRDHREYFTMLTCAERQLSVGPAGVGGAGGRQG